jgi:hypothetical protein
MRARTCNVGTNARDHDFANMRVVRWLAWLVHSPTQFAASRSTTRHPDSAVLTLAMELPVTAPALDIHYVPRALPTADADLAYLTAEIVWIEHMRARKTASFGLPYNYSGQNYPACAMPPVIAAIAERAAALAGHSFNNCLCNRYDTGANTMGSLRLL